MAEPNKVLIVAPYWCDTQHLGHVRVERFVRWLAEAGMQVVLIAGGEHDQRCEEPRGTLITLRDPLRIYRERRRQSATVPASRPLLRWLAYALLSPDPGIAWAWRAARHPLVMEHCADVRLVLSSSFPESSHVAAARLARRCAAPLVIDMRDGWLDEPMKPFLRQSSLRRMREARLERSILRQAATIIVTSGHWQQLLAQRLPFTASKTVVLTNAYPVGCNPAESTSTYIEQPSGHALTLLYAGRIFTSRAERRIEHLLAPLLAGLQNTASNGRLLFVGNLAQAELDALGAWRARFRLAGWEIETRPPVSRYSALELMQQADGLLLLSSSQASIPAKLFDYLCAQRPILALTPTASAVAELAPQIRQLFALDYRDAAVPIVANFIDACRGGMDFDLPAQFDEAWLRAAFLAIPGCKDERP